MRHACARAHSFALFQLCTLRCPCRQQLPLRLRKRVAVDRCCVEVIDKLPLVTHLCCQQNVLDLQAHRGGGGVKECRNRNGAARSMHVGSDSGECRTTILEAVAHTTPMRNSICLISATSRVRDCLIFTSGPASVMLVPARGRQTERWVSK